MMTMNWAAAIRPTPTSGGYLRETLRGTWVLSSGLRR